MSLVVVDATGRTQRGVPPAGKILEAPKRGCSLGNRGIVRGHAVQDAARVPNGEGRVLRVVLLSFPEDLLVVFERAVEAVENLEPRRRLNDFGRRSTVQPDIPTGQPVRTMQRPCVIGKVRAEQVPRSVRSACVGLEDVPAVPLDLGVVGDRHVQSIDGIAEPGRSSKHRVRIDVTQPLRTIRKDDGTVDPEGDEIAAQQVEQPGSQPNARRSDMLRQLVRWHAHSLGGHVAFYTGRKKGPVFESGP